ncbi:hypothetical protein STCU_10981 [Strigomonas culicis]|uniref:Uncharacterized protein n=1 Tax=Strigomonas culicis TaxID=28005 RepID=S9V1W1_9TRYP|nr:hypothetical protein STCU_10981 [Strigomonas culicis]|eukprot:EPY16805.1 hypothetical protein STCU_10981 [Strigomonas culicis]
MKEGVLAGVVMGSQELRLPTPTPPTVASLSEGHAPPQPTTIAHEDNNNNTNDDSSNASHLQNIICSLPPRRRPLFKRMRLE